MNITIKKSFSLLVALLLLALTLPEAGSAQAAPSQKLLVSPSMQFESNKFALGAFTQKLRPNTDPTPIWHTFLGGSGDDIGYSVIVDESGNIYVAGLSVVSWGSPLRALSGNGDAFVAKLDSSGTLLWHTFLGGNTYDRGFSIALDGNGNIYISGSSYGTWGNPIQAHYGNSDAFIAKLDSSGNLLWNTFFGNPSTYDDGHGITVDETGNVYLAGTLGAPGAYVAFVAKFDPSGNLTWALPMGGSGYDQASSVVVDASGNIFVSGISEATWGSPLRAFSTGTDSFIAKINPTGSLIWNTFLGGSGIEDSIYSIVLDESGNIYATGYSDATWGNPIQAYSAGRDTLTLKLDSSGNLLWNTFMGGIYDEFNTSIVVDGIGNIYVTGENSVNYGVVLIYNSSGSLLSETAISGSGYGIARDENGNTYVTGKSINSWGTPIRSFSGGASDAFVLKLTDDVTPPTVLSVTRASTNPTSALSVNFSVTFSESVTGVAAADFSLTTTGGVNGASVTNVSGSGVEYTVTINTGSGSGTIRLDLPVSASIADLNGFGLDGLPYAGSQYTIEKNNAPTEISLSPSSASENQPAGLTVGTFTTTDPNGDDTFTYSLVSGTGSDDNAAFSITGNTLKTAQPFNFLVKNSYSIRVRSTDSGGLFLEKVFTIGITNSPPIFADVPDSYWAVSYIERLYNAGITGGCTTHRHQAKK